MMLTIIMLNDYTIIIITIAMIIAGAMAMTVMIIKIVLSCCIYSRITSTIPAFLLLEGFEKILIPDIFGKIS